MTISPSNRCPGCSRATLPGELENALGLCDSCFGEIQEHIESGIIEPNAFYDYSLAPILQESRPIHINWPEVGWFLAAVAMLAALIALGFWEAQKGLL